MFENLQVDIDSLPSVQKVKMTKLVSAYKYKILLANVIVMIILAIVSASFSYFIISEGYGWVIPWMFVFVIALPAIIVMLGFLAFQKKRYALRDKDIIYNSGLITHHQISVPINRIQHVEIQQGLLDKALNLANLDIFTAGGSGSDLRIPGLRPETAEKIRSFLLKKLEFDEEE